MFFLKRNLFSTQNFGQFSNSAEEKTSKKVKIPEKSKNFANTSAWMRNKSSK